MRRQHLFNICSLKFPTGWKINGWFFPPSCFLRLLLTSAGETSKKDLSCPVIMFSLSFARNGKFPRGIWPLNVTQFPFSLYPLRVLHPLRTEAHLFVPKTLNTKSSSGSFVRIKNEIAQSRLCIEGHQCKCSNRDLPLSLSWVLRHDSCRFRGWSYLWNDLPLWKASSSVRCVHTILLPPCSPFRCALRPSSLFLIASQSLSLSSVSWAICWLFR